jgi:hypothetical protein
MLHCQAEGKAAKGLVTYQSPHVPEPLTTRYGGIEEKSEPRVLRVSIAIHQHHALNKLTLVLSNVSLVGDFFPYHSLHLLRRHL